jgi:hypothetical protein
MNEGYRQNRFSNERRNEWQDSQDTANGYTSSNNGQHFSAIRLSALIKFIHEHIISVTSPSVINRLVATVPNNEPQVSHRALGSSIPNTDASARHAACCPIQLQLATTHMPQFTAWDERTDHTMSGRVNRNLPYIRRPWLINDNYIVSLAFFIGFSTRYRSS